MNLFNLEDAKTIEREMALPDGRGTHFGVSVDSLVQKLKKINFKNNVPQEVSKQIELCKTLCLYSYFQWEFASVGMRLSFMAIETALKERLRLYYPDGFQFKDKVTGEVRREKPHSLSAFASLLKRGNLKFLGTENFFKDGRITLHSLIKWAKSKNIFEEKHNGHSEALKNLRNHSAHPLGVTIVTPWEAIDLIYLNAVLIDAFFNYKNGENF